MTEFHRWTDDGRPRGSRILDWLGIALAFMVFGVISVWYYIRLWWVGRKFE